MKCRAAGCDRDEWMARNLCGRHWGMLPFELQLAIRSALKHKRAKPKQNFGVDGLFERAFGIIAQVEKEQHEEATVALFRTRMAAVAGLIATIRQLPFSELRDQLEKSGNDLLVDHPALFAERQELITRDLAFLEFLNETREQLGKLIKKLAPAVPLTIHNEGGITLNPKLLDEEVTAE